MRAAVMGMRHGHISEFVRAVEENPAVSLVGIAEDEPTVRRQSCSRTQCTGVRGTSLNCSTKSNRRSSAWHGRMPRKYLALTACLERGIHVIADKPLLTEMGAT